MGSSYSSENSLAPDEILHMSDVGSGSATVLYSDDANESYLEEFHEPAGLDLSMASSSSMMRERTFDSKSSVTSEVSLLSQRLGRGRRSLSHGHLSQSSDDGYGWFDDGPAKAALEAPVSTTPIYVLESSLSTQKLWYETAGRRPRQPENERRYYEQLWRDNFENSSIKYDAKPEEEEPKQSIPHHRKRSHSLDGEHDIIFKGKGSFSNSVSRSFIEDDFQTLTLQMPRFKIAKLENGELRASFLVVLNINGVTFGVWRHHSEFKLLADKVTEYS